MRAAKSAEERLARLDELASPCRLCPRDCEVVREEGELGSCGAAGGPGHALVSSVFPHFGEEDVLVGRQGLWGGRGSGTIFMAGCNLLCVFCQNFGLSRATDAFKEVSPAEVVELCLQLEASGCANINFVTPTHFAACLARGVDLARAQSLALPVVWNCGGYESVEALRLLQGTVDIYMPDAKTLDPSLASQYLNAQDYPAVLRAALEEMARQVGPLKAGADGLAVRGLMVRHLLMPGREEDARAIIDLVAEVCPGAAINVMGQYHPAGLAAQHPELQRLPDARAVQRLRRYAAQQGLWELNR